MNNEVENFTKVKKKQKSTKNILKKIKLKTGEHCKIIEKKKRKNYSKNVYRVSN